MKWIVDGIEMAVEALSDKGGVAHFRIDGDDIEVSFRRLTEGRIQFEMDGRSRVATVHSVGGGRHVALEGATHVVEEVQPVRRGGGMESAGSSGAVYPPMPGVVVEVCVEVGDVVDKGQRLVLITAMKMETAVVAPRAGQIREVCVGAGDSVMPSDLLVALAEEETDG